MIRIKRAYEKATKDDGYRVLVDRLWPRGLSKQKAHLGLWLKEIAPSNELRTWFGHDPKKWPQFKRRYSAELRKNKSAVAELKALVKKHKSITLVYGAKDEQHNNAVVLKDFL